MARVSDWSHRLQSLINEHRETPFAWGTHDCSLWAAKAVLAVTGEDHTGPWAGKYRSLRGAERLMRKAGYEGPEGIADAVLGNRKPVAQARQGDIVACDLHEHYLAGEDPHIGLSLGVCNGHLSYFVSESGLIALPILTLELAWSV